MKKILFLTTCLSVILPQSIFAAEISECSDLIYQAENETTATTDIYDFCGFNDEKTTWEQWAPFASLHQLKKALYQICIRYPEHIYHDTYCEKSASLGYGPALAVKAETLLEKGEEKTGLQWATKAIETKELSTEQTGKLLEKIGVYYYKNNNPKYEAYLEQAAVRRSALANHMLSVLSYENFVAQPSEKREKTTFQYIWRAILLDCPNAQENLGLFHLARQNKISPETAKLAMRNKMKTCQSTSDDDTDQQEKLEQKEMYDCQCKTVLTAERRFQEKPYLLLKVENDTAFLKDNTDTEYQVQVEDNLPNQGKVSEIHKSGIVLTYPNDRIILNLYKPDKCAQFCMENQIEENLTPEEMEKRLKGETGIIIQPYHLTFTPQECETLHYYAPELVDVSLPFVGKTECESVSKQSSEQPILNQIERIKEQSSINASSNEKENVNNQKGMSNQLKKRFKSFGENLMEAK